MKRTVPNVPGLRMRPVRVEIPSALLFAVLIAVYVAVRAWLPDILEWQLETAVDKVRARRFICYYDFIAGVLLLGIALPKLWDYVPRKRHAERWKARELTKWGYHSRDREGPMINCVYYPVAYETAVANGKRFYSEWLIIHDGCIIVNPGESIVYREQKLAAYDFGSRKTYAWDGCTPKWPVWWLVIVGTPDWAYGDRTVKEVDTAGRIVDRPVVWPLAHHASLFHDALCQYIDHIPLSRGEVNVLFREMLRESGMCWPMAWVYYLFVCLLSSRKTCGADCAGTAGWRAIFKLECGGGLTRAGSG